MTASCFSFYLDFVSTHKFLSAFIQFALLGTLGEFVSYKMRTRSLPRHQRPHWHPHAYQLPLVMLAWGALGLFIKVGFLGTKGALGAIIEQGLLPESIFVPGSIPFALALSTLTNLFFGPQMMFAHRISDALIFRHWSLAGFDRALKTLLWFWIPAHTLTFILPSDLQIGLAALWSVVLGLIMGLTMTMQSQKVE